MHHDKQTTVTGYNHFNTITCKCKQHSSLDRHNSCQCYKKIQTDLNLLYLSLWCPTTDIPCFIKQNWVYSFYYISCLLPAFLAVSMLYNFLMFILLRKDKSIFMQFFLSESAHMFWLEYHILLICPYVEQYIIYFDYNHARARL